MIPLFKASVGKDELKAVERVFKTCFLGKWKQTEKFEKEFAKFTGAKYCVGTNSGTAALHLALMACGIKEGDEVLVPSLTFVSTALVVLYVGAKPVWVDVRPDTLCMSPTDVAKKIGPKTRAIIPVHYGGQPADIDLIKIIIKKFEKKFGHKIFLISDAAQASGSKYPNGKRVGCCQWSDVTAFSFEAKKPASCGGGGAVTTNNKDLAKKIGTLSWLGINKGTKERMSKGKYNWQYDVVDVNGFYGYKYHMCDIEAAILSVQLKKLDMMNAKRRHIVERYNKAFKNIPWIRIIKRSKGSACWNYAIILNGVDRKKFIEYLVKKNCSVGVHYEALNRHSIFKQFKKASTPITDDVWKKLVILPCFPDLSLKDQNYVIKCIKSYRGNRTS